MNNTANAVVFEKPGVMSLRAVELAEPTADDCVIDMLWSGISTGTERLLWDGRMPAFPGLAYPLVPGYESVGRVTQGAGEREAGELVFVPGSSGYQDVSGLFGASSERVVVDSKRVVPISEQMREEGILLALTATAHHAATRLQASPFSESSRDAIDASRLPELIVGHGVLGRLLARMVVSLGGDAPTVWETNEKRCDGAQGYRVVHPDEDSRSDYSVVADVSGDADLVNTLIGRLRPHGTLILAGFYHAPIQFAFPPAFQREATLAIAAEWQRPDLDASLALVESGALSLSNLITHHQSVRAAAPAYRAAFGDPDCLKMVLDWRCGDT